MALDWQTLQIGFGAGLYTKDDKRFSSPPALDIARDVQFEEIGGLQLRYPFVAMSAEIFGGGTLANWRRFGIVNDELLIFTDTALYSWSPDLGQWIMRAAHPAVSTDWITPISTNADQVGVDRAELNGIVMYCWSEKTVFEDSFMYVAAISKATGAVVMPPTRVDYGRRMRLVALSTHILIFYITTSGDLIVNAVDPANLAGAVVAGGYGHFIGSMYSHAIFDVVRHAPTDTAIGACPLGDGTGYLVFSVTSALDLVTSTKLRLAHDAIAITPVPGAPDRVHVFRADSETIKGDVINTTDLADVAVNQAIGTYSDGCGHLTACYRSVASGGHYTCAVFWTAGFEMHEDLTFEPDLSAPFGVIGKKNTVDDAGTIGTQSPFAPGLGIRSRAFDVGGSVFVNMLFAARNSTTGSDADPQLNNVYVLFREDGTIHGKAIASSAGDDDTMQVLPGVSNTDGTTYHWAATVRRVFVPSGGLETAFGARSLADIAITFGSDGARRMAQIGLTGYVSGAEILAYDGVRLVEVGFNVMPYNFNIADSGSVSAMAPGTYGYKATYAYQNAKGETERSTTAAYAVLVHDTLRPSPVWPSPGPLYTTRKIAPPPAFEIWRTTVDPPPEAPYYLATSIDPTQTSNPNRYLLNSTDGLPTWEDSIPDAALIARAPNPENGDVLECMAPPGASIIFATDTRLYLGGVAGDPDRVWPSRERGDGEIVSFHDALTIDVPRRGGAMTAVWIMDDVLYVGRQYAIYAIPGAGFDNAGRGPGWGPSQTISLDLGPVSQEGIALTPLGVLMSTAKGWYLLDHGRSLRYVGGAVAAFDGDTVRAAHVVSAQHQVRILTSARMLVWDYRGAVDAVTPDALGQWAEWTIPDGLDAAMWRGRYVCLTTSGPFLQGDTLDNLTYAFDVETSWIKARDLAGFGKLGAIIVTGESRSESIQTFAGPPLPACLVRIRLARDYQYDESGNPSYFDDRAWPPSPVVPGTMQVRHVPSAGNSNVEAIKVRITAVAEATRATISTLGMQGDSGGFLSESWVWDTQWEAMNTYPGEMGNAITMSIAFRLDATIPAGGLSYVVDVRDHFTFDPHAGAPGRWRERVNNVGVLVRMRSDGSLASAILQSAIDDATNLIEMLHGDPVEDAIVPVASLVENSPYAVAGVGGTYAPPIVEGFKLTGLGLEVGLHRGLYKRLTAAQKQ